MKATGSLSESTSSSLLARVRRRESEAWRRLTLLYGPLVYRWGRTCGLQDSDAADVMQETFLALAARIESFHKDNPGDSFRGWLWTIARNKIRDHFRRAGRRPDVAAGGPSDEPSQQFAAANSLNGDEPQDAAGEVTAALVHRAVELVQAEFESRTWQAFWRVAVDGLTPADAAQELAMSTRAVYMAKWRVLHRLRDQLSDALE